MSWLPAWLGRGGFQRGRRRRSGPRGMVPKCPTLGILRGLAALAHGASNVAKGAPVADPWQASDLLPPTELASLLSDPKRERPVIVHVGFDLLYRAGRTRRCRLRAAPFQDAAEWLAQFQRFWEAKTARAGD